MALPGDNGSLELVIFMGLQASGKSSFFHARFASTHVQISKDDFPNNKNPNRRQLILLEAALREGRSVICDNTNPTIGDRAPLIALGRSLGARIVGYYFESRMEDCLRRNRQREGKKRVPDVAIFATRKKFECPSLSEGFDQLTYVRMVGEVDWEESPWIEEGQGNETM